MKTLPTHEECKQRIEQEMDSALHRFIYENEPAGELAAKAFRTELLDLVNELITPDQEDKWKALGGSW